MVIEISFGRTGSKGLSEVPRLLGNIGPLEVEEEYHNEPDGIMRGSILHRLISRIDMSLTWLAMLVKIRTVWPKSWKALDISMGLAAIFRKPARLLKI